MASGGPFVPLFAYRLDNMLAYVQEYFILEPPASNAKRLSRS